MNRTSLHQDNAKRPGGLANIVTNRASEERAHLIRTPRSWAALTLLSLTCSGCAVVAVADAAVTVVATTVSVGVTVVGTAVDVTAAGVKAVVGSDEKNE